MGQPASAPVQEQELPSPHFDRRVWMASCRKLGSMSEFAQFLLYQPDCRLFCDKAKKCKHFKCNDGEEHEHLETFLHVSHRVARTAAKEDMKQRGYTQIVNDSASRSVCVPFTSKCWLIPSDTADLSCFPEELRARTVVLFVHGFRFTQNRIIKTCMALRDATEDCDCAVLAFAWPAHRHKKSYSKARAHAADAAERLRALLLLLARLRCQVHIVAHSLGCRVSMAALLDTEAAHVRYVALLGAAVSRDALQPDGEFPRARLAASKIGIFFSARDSVLSSYFWLGESVYSLSSSEAALGLEGPLPGLARTSPFDVSAEVPSHSAERYLLAPTFLHQLATELSHSQLSEQGMVRVLSTFGGSEIPGVVEDQDSDSGSSCDSE